MSQDEGYSLDFSIVIPTLNEERRIAAVIQQFRVLDGYYRHEVIVGDGGSTDRTAEIAQRLGARVVIDPALNKTIASGRNAGASVARGKILIFCDADTLLSNVRRLASRIEHEFRHPDVVAAVPKMQVFPELEVCKDRVFHLFFNTLVKTSLYLRVPVSGGQCQVVRTSTFRSIGGYTAEKVHAEDSDLLYRLLKRGKLRFIDDVTVYESPRRYRKYGYFQVSCVGVCSVFGQAILHRNVLHNWRRVD